MLKYRNIVCIIFISVAFHLTAQQNTVPKHPDSVTVASLPDTVTGKKTFKPDPKKAVIYSAIFPGLGQIYNRKYWKLPILYGGFVGLTYAITWNNSHYQDYFDAQRALLDDNPDNDDIWKKMLPYGMDPETADRNWFSDVVKDRKNYFRYYRDLSIIITVALYGLGIVDAYVDAQLFEFDVSPDLSMRVEPVLMNRVETNYLADSFGFKCSISF